MTLSRSLPSELSLPVSDVQVMGWPSSSLPWEVQHSVALPVAMVDMPMPVAECAREVKGSELDLFSPDGFITELREHSCLALSSVPEASRTRHKPEDQGLLFVSCLTRPAFLDMGLWVAASHPRCVIGDSVFRGPGSCGPPSADIVEKSSEG